MTPAGTEAHKAITIHDLENARLMLVHAASKGMELPKDMVLTLGNAIEGASAYDGRAVQPVDFWIQFTTLAKMLLPVTPESLRCCADPANGLSPARMAARRYNVWGYAILFLLFLAQAYWFALTSVVDHFRANQDIVRWHEHWNDATRSALRDTLGREPTDAEVAREKDKVYFATADVTSSIEGRSGLRIPKAMFSAVDINYLAASQQASIEAVGHMAGWASWLMYPRYAETGETYSSGIRAKNIRDLQAARILIDLLNRYVLPILYGLAGASLYVVRSLGNDIRRALYTESANTGFNLRFLLGGVAGFAAAWFMLPPAATAPGITDALPTIASLSPLAASFVAGYAVEILFSVTDRIIAALTAINPKPA
jgi:hypothetical protein